MEEILYTDRAVKQTDFYVQTEPVDLSVQGHEMARIPDDDSLDVRDRNVFFHLDVVALREAQVSERWSRQVFGDEHLDVSPQVVEIV